MVKWIVKLAVDNFLAAFTGAVLLVVFVGVLGHFFGRSYEDSAVIAIFCWVFGKSVLTSMDHQKREG